MERELLQMPMYEYVELNMRLDGRELLVGLRSAAVPAQSTVPEALHRDRSVAALRLGILNELGRQGWQVIDSRLIDGSQYDTLGRRKAEDLSPTDMDLVLEQAYSRWHAVARPGGLSGTEDPSKRTRSDRQLEAPRFESDASLEEILRDLKKRGIGGL